MKKLLSLLAVAALLPVSASAEVLQNVTLKGEIQTIASDVSHNSANVYNEDVSTRVLAGFSMDLVEDVTANLMFQYANIWGGDDATGRTVNNYEDTVRLVEANVVLHNLFCCLEATVGRQFYGDEDSAVMYIGPNHYNAEFNGLTNSVDAAKITYADDVKSFTVIAGKVNGTMGAPVTAWAAIPGLPVQQASWDVFGADFRVNLTDELTAQVYGYDMHDTNGVTFVKKHTGVYGAKLSLNTPVRLSAEYARNFAGDRLVKERHDTGEMVKVDAAMDVEKATVRGTFYYANENFLAWGNYTPGLLIGHRAGGAIYDYSAKGVALFNLGVDVKPFEKWTVSLDGYSFQDKNFKHTATWEADLTAKYAHNEYVELFAGVGYAKNTGSSEVGAAGLPVNFNKAVLGSDNVKGQLGMLIKF